MSDPQMILLILGAAATLWQLVIACAGISYARAGRSVTIGWLPGLFAVIFFIVVVLL